MKKVLSHAAWLMVLRVLPYSLFLLMLGKEMLPQTTKVPVHPVEVIKTNDGLAYRALGMNEFITAKDTLDKCMYVTMKAGVVRPSVSFSLERCAALTSVAHSIP